MNEQEILIATVAVTERAMRALTEKFSDFSEQQIETLSWLKSMRDSALRDLKTEPLSPRESWDFQISSDAEDKGNPKRNKQMVWELAAFLKKYNLKLSGKQLAECLNDRGFRTTYNSTYQGGRGIYRLLAATYKWLISEGFEDDADIVACAFTNAKGNLAWE